MHRIHLLTKNLRHSIRFTQIVACAKIQEARFLDAIASPGAVPLVSSLYIIQGRNRGARFDLAPNAGAITIGREPGNFIQLDDHEVSRRHAEIRRVDGTFVVNLGDMFKVWTNDVYVSNLHRVVIRLGKERYSIPTFFNLDYDAPVSCLPTCQSPENPPRYQPIRSGDYLVQRFRDVQKFGRKVADLEAEAAARV